MDNQPNQSPCYITSLRTNEEDGQKHVLNLINQLIKKSKSAGFCIEDKNASDNQSRPTIKPLLKAEDILRENRNEHWPNWYSQNCIVLGSLKQPLEQIDLHFLHDCRDDHPNGHYDQLCQKILAHYDWAFFSYFTTFSAGLLTFITNQEHLHHWVNSLPHLNIAERYDSPTLGMAQLRSATFYDYQEQWLAPIWLAKQLNEPTPLLLCAIEIDESLHTIYSHVEDDYIENTQYFAQHTQKLTLIEEWQDNPYSGYTTPIYTFQLFEINNLEAYHSLWSKVSSDGRIAHCVLSADCNIILLKEYVKNLYSHENLSYFIKNKKLASWGYINFYGGGADEHMGIFYANDGKITDLFWQGVGQNVHDLLPNALHSAIFYDEKEHWQLPLLLNKKPGEMPIILCQFHPDNTYNLWSPEDFEYIEDTIWYEDILSHLTCLDTFMVDKNTYHLYLLNDELAYHELCTSDTMGAPIVQAIFAADCDITALKNLLIQSEYYCAENLNQVASWMLSKYDDRSSTYFYAKDTQTCKLFYDLLRVDQTNHNAQVSRF